MRLGRAEALAKEPPASRSPLLQARRRLDDCGHCDRVRDPAQHPHRTVHAVGSLIPRGPRSKAERKVLTSPPGSTSFVIVSTASEPRFVRALSIMGLVLFPLLFYWDFLLGKVFVW